MIHCYLILFHDLLFEIIIYKFATIITLYKFRFAPALFKYIKHAFITVLADLFCKGDNQAYFLKQSITDKISVLLSLNVAHSFGICFRLSCRMVRLPASQAELRRRSKVLLYGVWLVLTLKKGDF